MRQWWKRVHGQSLNAAGIASFLSVATREPHLALPHLSVSDLRWIDWAELERIGLRGVVFDKDNTLTAPYSLCLFPKISAAFSRCQAVFPGRIAVFSNSVGLHQYDADSSEARAFEESVGGIHVIRHEMKKPAGTAEDIENYFGCPAADIVMVGDRYFTDIVYGNRNGFLSILTEPLCPSEEPFIVKQAMQHYSVFNPLGHYFQASHPLNVRKLEDYLVQSWYKSGLKPIRHVLLSEAHSCVKDPPS